MTPNQTLNGRYKIIRPLGEGGMANVYLAHDLILDRDVAVKLVRFDMQDDVSAIKRFQREALSTTELVHPNIVGVYDIGEEHGMNYLIMEYVEGQNLKQYIRDQFPIPLGQVVSLMSQILNGVQTAHYHGIIHRDLKPQNILIDKHGKAKITDFGIAIANQQSSFTRTNTVIGSVQYLSPEQVRGHIATQQSDIYSLGIILFEMLTGKVPFEGESAVSIAVKHYQDQLPLVKDFNTKIPQSLENVVLKATAKNPIDRYKNVAEMAADLKTVLQPERANESKFVEDSLVEHTIVLNQDELKQGLAKDEVE
ncbi:Stk1 family PASTA domain-containing Ser/Thr kinase [Pediococcus pentosaceus]